MPPEKQINPDFSDTLCTRSGLGLLRMYAWGGSGGLFPGKKMEPLNPKGENMRE